VNEKKYYGLQKNINEYKRLISDLFDVDAVLDYLKNNVPELGQEKLPTKAFLLGLISFIGDWDWFKSSSVMKIGELIKDSFVKGSKRVMNRQGVNIGLDFDIKPRGIDKLMRDQDKYFANTKKKVVDGIKTVLVRGMDEGQSVKRIEEDIRRVVVNVSKKRARTIARTEIVKASNLGTIEAMENSGIEEYDWITAGDRIVCEKCVEFEKNSPYKVAFSSPLPARNSHPNCRCTIVMH